MYMQATKSQPRKPEPCDYCAGEDVPDQTPKTVRRYNVFPHGVFVLCAEHAEELAR